MLVAGATGRAWKLERISGKFTHVWKSKFMSIETELCHVVLIHVKDMLHRCLHALLSCLKSDLSWPFWELHSTITVFTDSTEHTVLFPCQLAYFNIWHAHAIFFILHFLAQLRTLKPPYCNAILSETRAIRCIYYVYSVFLTVVTIQYTEISHRRRGARVAWWALGNVTTCHIGRLKMLFHGPSLPILSTYH